MKLKPHVVAALVEARQNRGRCGHSKGSYDAVGLGLMEQMATHYELNMRGQDVADEAISLAKSKEKPK